MRDLTPGVAIPLSSSSAFTSAQSTQRIDALLDRDSFKPLGQVEDPTLIAGTGEIGGRPVAIAATRREIAGGSIGVADAKQMSAVLQRCREHALPCILCLDSAGARLDEGLPALGAFRQMYRNVLDARIDDLPMLVLVGRDCFGGASMLAAAGSRRIYAIGSRLAMSGPAVIQALGGRNELDASDGQAVNALMGGTARARLDADARLCEDSLYAFRQAALDWLSAKAPGTPVDLKTRHNLLGTRLFAHGMAPSPDSNRDPDIPYVLRELAPESFRAVEIDGVLQGRTAPSSPDSFLGLLHGVPVGALTVWTLAGACLALADDHPGEAVTLLLDSPGQAPTFNDERVMLSEYVVHLALVLTSLRVRGHRVTLQVLGEAAGGIYVALAAPASKVVALPGANVRMLPPAAIARIIGSEHARGSIDEFVDAGVIDTLM